MATGETLILEVRDFIDPQHWRWVLKDSCGKFLADQEVDLDSRDSNYSAFIDLEGFLKVNSSTDRWLEDQIRLMKQVGSWMGKEALGQVGERIAKFSVPVTVRVQVPSEATGLLYRPWEMAIAGGKPLALRNASLVYEITGEKPEINIAPVQERLRMLAVFSLPTDISSLSLRRERYQLMKLIEQLAQTRGVAIDMRILQYGTTRENLLDALEEGEGWDLIHFSGHGDKAMLILEKPDGSHDAVSSEELSDLLSLACGRLKLVTLSACFSAAATVKETLEWLKIPVAETEGEGQVSASPQQPPMPALAVELMAKLDCAVLAMRYPVGDEFAIRLASELYRMLLEKGNALPRSLQLAMQKALEEEYNAAIPPLSLATPALFGSRSAEMIIKPPLAPEGDFVPPSIGLSYFPPEPKRFVGRSRPLGRASSAMASDSEKRGVLFQGMAGAGKTACALETAYHQSRSHRFRHFVWHQAPKENEEIEGSLVKLALDIQKQLPWVKMVHLVDRSEEFKAWLPVLSKMLEQNSILIVLDNLENLLASDGGWKDERWGWLIDALLNHDGLSRLILTSRNPLRDLEGNSRLIVEQINSLSRNEAMLLAKEMPSLGRLLMGKSPVGLERGRDLVRRTLSLVQGHPKLIELAENQADNPEALSIYLDKATEAWIGSDSMLSAFFKEGESSLDAEKFLKMLYDWTHAASATLPASSRILFHFLCALEESDRQSWITEPIWPKLWTHLGLSGPAPCITETLENMKALVEVQAIKKGYNYVIHSVVAEAGQEELENGFRKMVDEETSRFFMTVLEGARGREMEGTGKLIIRAGLSAAPYLMRLNHLSITTKCLEEAVMRDSSLNTIALVIPVLRRIIDATSGTNLERKNSRLLARLLIEANRMHDAEIILRPLIADCVTKGELVLARSAATDLFIILRDSRPKEALELAEKIKNCTIKLDLGPWTQIQDEGRKLQALNKLGKYLDTLNSVTNLRLQMKALPEHSEQDELVEIWNAKEIILSTGLEAAINFGRTNQILELTNDLLEIRRARGAPVLELARGAFSNYSALIRLKKYDEAEKLLHFCRTVFEKENSIPDLVKVFGALSILMDNKNLPDSAIRFGKMALRLAYKAQNMEDISIMHNNLGNYLAKTGSTEGLAHHLVEAMLSYLGDRDIQATTLKHLSIDLIQFGSQAIPATFDQLCDRVEQVEGVHFRELWARLPKRAEDGDQLLKEIIEAAKA
ncbi:MAG: CHAT domain-containing protein [Methanothrix sp.]